MKTDRHISYHEQIILMKGCYEQLIEQARALRIKAALISSSSPDDGDYVYQEAEEVTKQAETLHNEIREMQRKFYISRRPSKKVSRLHFCWLLLSRLFNKK